jgi:hypothetical protein
MEKIKEYNDNTMDISIKDIYCLRRDLQGYIFNNLLDDIQDDVFTIINRYLPKIYINGHTV